MSRINGKKRFCLLVTAENRAGNRSRGNRIPCSHAGIPRSVCTTHVTKHLARSDFAPPNLGAASRVHQRPVQSEVGAIDLAKASYDRQHPATVVTTATDRVSHILDSSLTSQTPTSL